jgi:hypothetical protein
MEQARREIEIARKRTGGDLKREMERVRRELGDARDEMEKERQRTHAFSYSYSDGAEANAGHSENGYEKMLDKMEKRGLIDRSAGYKITKEGDELFINGKKQPEEVFNQYSEYLKYKSISIKGNKGHLKISIND